MSRMFTVRYRYFNIYINIDKIYTIEQYTLVFLLANEVKKIVD